MGTRIPKGSKAIDLLTKKFGKAGRQHYIASKVDRLWSQSPDGTGVEYALKVNPAQELMAAQSPEYADTLIKRRKFVSDSLPATRRAAAYHHTIWPTVFAPEHALDVDAAGHMTADTINMAVRAVGGVQGVAERPVLGLVRALFPFNPKYMNVADVLASDMRTGKKASVFLGKGASTAAGTAAGYGLLQAGASVLTSIREKKDSSEAKKTVPAGGSAASSPTNTVEALTAPIALKRISDAYQSYSEHQDESTLQADLAPVFANTELTNQLVRAGWTRYVKSNSPSRMSLDSINRMIDNTQDENAKANLKAQLQTMEDEFGKLSFYDQVRGGM